MKGASNSRSAGSRWLYSSLADFIPLMNTRTFRLREQMILTNEYLELANECIAAIPLITPGPNTATKSD